MFYSAPREPCNANSTHHSRGNDGKRRWRGGGRVLESAASLAFPVFFFLLEITDKSFVYSRSTTLLSKHTRCEINLSGTGPVWRQNKRRAHQAPRFTGDDAFGRLGYILKDFSGFFFSAALLFTRPHKLTFFFFSSTKSGAC